MTTNKYFLMDYLLKYFTIGEGHSLVDLSLELVMEKFSTLAFPNYRNFMFRSKNFVRSERGTMDSIMAHKDHSTYKFVQGCRFPWQSKDKVFVFKIFVDLPSSGVELVKRMQIRGDNEDGDPSLPMVTYEFVFFFFPLVYELGQGDAKVYQTILMASAPTNMQGLQGCEDNRQRQD